MPSEALDILRLRSSLDDVLKPAMWIGTLAEFVATLLFVLVGCASTLSKNQVNIALCFGLGIAALVWVFGDVSGGHINPAVTLAMLVTRRVSFVRALLYIAAQLVGSIAGTALDRIVLFPTAPTGFCVTKPAAGLLGRQAFAVELFATSVLLFTIFATCDRARRQNGSGALAIGLAVSLSHFAFIPVTGASMNPARSFGPAVLEQDQAQQWIYWAGPMVGGSVAGLLYDFVFAKEVSFAKARRFVCGRAYDPEEAERTEYQSFPLNREEEE